MILAQSILDWLGACIPADVPSAVGFLLLASLAAMLFAMAKAGFGGAVGMLAVPIMTIGCGSGTLATGIMLPMLIVADYVAVITWWRQWDLRTIAKVLPGMFLGVAAGWALLRAIDALGANGAADRADAALQIAIGLVAIGFVAMRFYQHKSAPSKDFQPTGVHATLTGATAGVTSTLAHAAGPIAAIYLLPQGMPRGRYVATTAAFFWTLNHLKIPAYLVEGRITTGTLLAGLILVPGIAVGAVLGKVLHRRLSSAQFFGIVYLLLALAGVELIRKGIQGW